MNRKFFSRLLISMLLVISGQGLLVQNSMATETDQVSRLRTLFTTPLERKKLDELRNSGEFDKKQDQKTGEPVIREPLKVEVKGVVFRDKQKPVVWVNEGNTLKSQAIEDGIRVNASGVKKSRLKVPVKVFEQRLSMKPGQQWTETDRKVQDKYQIKRPEIETSEAAEESRPEDNKKDTTSTE